MTVEEIKAAILSLTLEERAEIMAELCAWSDDDWDRQMKRDAVAGKFDKLHRDAEAEAQAGKLIDLNTICT